MKFCPDWLPTMFSDPYMSTPMALLTAAVSSALVPITLPITPLLVPSDSMVTPDIVLPEMRLPVVGDRRADGQAQFGARATV